jgi:glycosyltransferase involved in cell wall biosynthesis
MTYQSTPLISVIIAVFNGVKTLQQCLNSVIQQNYKNIELIVIDGGSSDGTIDLLVLNSRDITYWISEADRGIYNAWNKALEQAHGDWICFLGADDFLWDEQVLVRMVTELILIPPVIRVAYGQIMLINAASVKLHAIGKPWEEVKENFKHVMCIPHPAVMHRRSLFLQHGAFDESFRIAGDYELLLRELRTNDAFFIPGLVMTAMRQGGVSTNPDNTLLGLQEVRAAQIKNGQRWPGLVWLLALTRAYTRSLLWSLMGEKMTRKILDFGRRIMGLPAYWTKI